MLTFERSRSHHGAVFRHRAANLAPTADAPSRFIGRPQPVSRRLPESVKSAACLLAARRLDGARWFAVKASAQASQRG